MAAAIGRPIASPCLSVTDAASPYEQRTGNLD